MVPVTKRRSVLIFAVLLALFVAVLLLVPARLPVGTSLKARLRHRATVADRVAQYGPTARARWQPYFEKQGLAYPPQKLLLVGFKQEKLLHVYAAPADQPFRLVRTFPVLAASGTPGPKQRYGDYQVPEGFYRIESLNPNSAYHLALRVSYPNAFDRAQAQKDGRTNLGGDIMIHGSNVSIGCLAMGDPAAEDLFVLASEVGADNITVLLSPLDLRIHPAPDTPALPTWTRGLYHDLKTALVKLPTQ